MSRFFESTLTAKISKALLECAETPTAEDLEKDEISSKNKRIRELEDEIAKRQVEIKDPSLDVADVRDIQEDIYYLQSKVDDLRNGIDECDKPVKKLTEGWSGTIKSCGDLRQAIRDAGEDPSVEECRAVLDALKTSCEEAIGLTDDDYFQRGFQNIIDDIDMIYDDDDLSSDSVDWELEGFFDYCDAAKLWCDLGESAKLLKENIKEVNEAYKADDGQYPPYRFEEADAEFIRNLIGPGFKVEIRNSSVDDAPNGTIDIALDSKWVSGFMSSTRELDQEIDKYFTEKNPELEVHRNNTGMTLWLGEKSKKEGNINESAEGIAEFWQKFDNGEIKIGDTFANNVTLLDANKAKDYILADRGYEYVAAWAPELSGEDLVWGQGHYFDNKEDAEKYFKDKLSECDKTLKEDSYDSGIFKDIEDALVDAGFSVDRYIDTGVLTKNIGWEVSKDGKHTQLDCPGSWYDEDEDEDEEYDEGAKVVNESVTVVTSDGSTVDTQDAASVTVDNNTVSVTNGQTTVTITSTPSEPALDLPQEEPVEEVPTDEVVPEEPIENEVPTEEPSDEELVEVEDPIKDDVARDLAIEPGSDEEEQLNALYDEPEEDIIDADSLAVLKNQGNVYMIQLNNADLYYVCEDFDAETNEGSNASFYDSKEEADKDYFERVGVNAEN